ncbi:MAG: hypothetical protein V3W44_09555 [Dehalococcoidales bacterium]
MRRAIITCAGEAKRWAGETPKQLVDVEGEILLERTVRQCLQHGLSPIVVAEDDRFDVEGAELFMPVASRWWCETALSTQVLWTPGEHVLLLGDVWYSDAGFKVVAETKGLHWFGRARPSIITGGSGEVFAVSWDSSSAHRLHSALHAGLEHAKTDPDHFLAGSPWQPYRWLCGNPMERHMVLEREIWTEIADWTDDFDSVERYECWLSRRKRRFI